MMKPTMNNPLLAQGRVVLIGLLGLVLMARPLATAQSLSPASQVSLITYGPGNDDIASAFGHTEIRITDPAIGLDRNYSYGGFDYNTDSFLLKFLRGTLPYVLSVHSLYQVVYYYQQTNRSIREQFLTLTLSQRQKLYAALEKNALPQNREYRYRFYYDNCATRPRDMIVDACGDSLTIPSRSLMTGKSYRDLMNDYLTERPWYQLGMNLAIGHPSDEQTDGWHAMYLPNQVHDQFIQARLRQANGQVVPLVRGEQPIFMPPQTFPRELPFFFDPNVVFALLAIAVTVFTIRRYQRGRVDRWFDRLLFGIVGGLGWFLYLLWVGTDHGVTAWNPTLLWLMPLHLPLIFWATSAKSTARRRTTYFALTALLVVLGMVLSTVPGGVDVLFPMTLLVRCTVNLQVARRGRQLPVPVAEGWPKRAA